MINVLIAATAYLFCSVVSWFLLVDVWRNRFDLTLGDAVFNGFISTFGPISLLISSFIWITDDTRGNGSKIVWLSKRNAK